MFQILGHMTISSFKPHANFTSAPILEGNFKRTVQPAPFVVVQALSRIRLFATPWSATCQASLPITSSQSLLKLMSIVLVMPSNQLISVILFSSCLQSFPASGSSHLVTEVLELQHQPFQ